MPSTVLKEDVYQSLSEMILSGRLPPGAKLSEIPLANELRVSRTPVREAIHQLTHAGFAEHNPHCGARVITPGRQLVRDVFQIREALEGVATREAAQHMDASVLRGLRAHFETLRPRVAAGDLADVGDCIHERVLEASGNQLLKQHMAAYRLKIAWFQRMASGIPGRLAQAFREHESILSALESHDPAWAESVARAHVRSTQDDLLSALKDDA